MKNALSLAMSPMRRASKLSFVIQGNVRAVKSEILLYTLTCKSEIRTVRICTLKHAKRISDLTALNVAMHLLYIYTNIQRPTTTTDDIYIRIYVESAL